MKLLPDAPFIPFFIVPIIFKFPSPLIVKEEELLNFNPAPSKSDESSSFSLSVIVDSPNKIKFTFAPFLITNGPVCELSIVIEFNVIVGEIPFATSI